MKSAHITIIGEDRTDAEFEVSIEEGERVIVTPSGPQSLSSAGYAFEIDERDNQISVDTDWRDNKVVLVARIPKAADLEISTMFESSKGNRIGVIFYGTEGYLVQRSYTHCMVFDLNGKLVKEFKGGGDHFDNFVQAVRSRKSKDLNSDAFQGHLSAALAHLANISYYLGEGNKVSVKKAKAVLEKVKSRDNNILTLNRTVRHFQDNGADLDKYPMSMGPLLEFDPRKEVFTNSAEANKVLHREYRKPFICPVAEKV